MASTRAIVRDTRRQVEHIELEWIPLSDGRRLAARLTLPLGARAKPVPAILEYIPYRRRDGTRARDQETMFWFSANGYAYVRVDIAGTGDSDGLVEDEYVKREQDDALEIIEWLSRQRWCSSSVGMIGISWGGFNGLQVAARRPAALKAVVSICSTVDRYHDDVHYMGGCLLNDNLDWGGAFFTYGALPPDPAMVGDRRWRKLWKQRLEGLHAYPATWMRHQCHDAFWKHGSVIENYAAIRTPVLAVSGWADGYTAAVFRLVENLKIPCKGIVGPWGHKYPHQGIPGPAIDFLGECKRWWDRWLKDVDNGAEDDPDLRLYLQDAVSAAPHFEHREGRWLGIPDWPTTRIQTHTLYFGAGTLSASRPRRKLASRTVCSPQTTGLAGGEWCAYALGKVAPELALDQREDDAGSLVFDSEPLKQELKLVGQPVVKLQVAADQPHGFVAVRLNDVHPDGNVTRISYGLLNLCHRNTHAKAARLVPGRSYDVSVPLTELAQRIPRGHRLRIAISSSYWPMVWPSAQPVTLTVSPHGCSVQLPRLDRESGWSTPEFGPPRKARALDVTVERSGKEYRGVSHNIETGEAVFSVSRDDGEFVIDDIGTRLHYAKQKSFSIQRSDPRSAESTIEAQVHYRRDKWNARVETRTQLRASGKFFVLTASVRAYDNDREFFSREFKHQLPRNHL